MPTEKTDTAILPPGMAMRPLTEELFHCMTALIPQMSQDDQNKIRAYLCAPKTLPIAGLVTRLIESSPVLTREFEDQPFDQLRLTLGPLLCWGLTQPWAGECKIRECLNTWLDYLAGPNHAPNLSAAILGLGIVSLLGLDAVKLDDAGKARLHGDVYRSMQSIVPWTDASSSNEMVLVPLLALASAAPKETLADTPLPKNWNERVREVMRHLTVLDQKNCILTLVSKGLDKPTSLTVFKAADPLVWLMPEFRKTLMDLLPTTESARSKKLPWTPNSWQSPVGQNIRPGEVNRRLYEQYCPLLHLGLAMVAQEVDDWEDRAYINIFVDDFNKSKNTEAIALPEYLLSDAPSQ